MSGYLCPTCRSAMRRVLYSSSSAHMRQSHRGYSAQHSPKKDKVNIDELLASPTWSVRSLLPKHETLPENRISRTQLDHLLRLSALPQPESDEEEDKMLRTLESQLHFVREIQSVDTTGIEPLQAIRDETQAAIAERTIGVDTLKEALANEEFRGRNKRPRRRRDVPVDTRGAEDWDIMGTAERKVGSYFVVDSSK